MIDREILEARFNVYRLLSTVYRYPLQSEVLTALTNFELMEGTQSLLESFRELKLSVKGIKETMVENLNIEMTRLMEGPGLTPAPPFASYYLNGKQLMGTAAQTARQTYLKWQVAPKNDSIPPDHISLELGFLAFLAKQALDTLDIQQVEILHASHLFLKEQLLPWLVQFCSCIASNTAESFFTALSRFTILCIQADYDWLEDILSSEKVQEI